MKKNLCVLGVIAIMLIVGCQQIDIQEDLLLVSNEKEQVKKTEKDK